MRCKYHTPIDCYTEVSLDEFGELGRLFGRIALDPSAAIVQKMAFMMYGPTGNGKSSCAGALHKLLADCAYMVTWVDCAEWPTDFHDRDELVDELSSSSAQILVLDDLGKEPKHCHGDLGKVIFARSKLRARFDIITCNLNVDPANVDACEITEAYGSAVRSRLFGMCKRNMIHFDGPDHRMELGD